MTSSTAIFSALAKESEISPSDVKQLLDTYKSLKKTTSWFHPVSPYIVQLENFYGPLKNSNSAFSHSQLYHLASILKSIRQDNSQKAYEAADPLIKKMGVLVDYADKPFETFSLVASCSSELKADIKTIKYFLGTNDDTSLNFVIRLHSGALPYIAADAREYNDLCYAALDIKNCAKVSSYEFLTSACEAADALREENKFLYHLFKDVEVVQYVAPYKVKDVLDGSYYYKNTISFIEKQNFSKNQLYQAQLDSPHNINFIFEHAEQAENIAYLLSTLHHAMLGKHEQIRVEAKILEMKETTSTSFSNLAHAFRRLKQNNLLKIDHLNLILLICESKTRRFADQMAQSALEFIRDGQIITGTILNLIRHFPSTAYSIHETYQLLEIAGLTELKNAVYLKAAHISQAVPAILKKLNEEGLLSRENVQKVLENLHNADSILSQLTSQLSFEKIIQAYESAKPCSEVVGPLSPWR